jgi:hypothetical protein
MPKYQVFIDNILIGYSDFEYGDPPRGVVSGILSPLPAYERFRSQFITLRDSSQKHLALSVARSNGEVIPALGISIFDYSTELAEIQVTVLGIAYPLYEELFPDLVCEYNFRGYKSIDG